jgi:hypothetical protein
MPPMTVSRGHLPLGSASSLPPSRTNYFTEFTWSKALLYILCAIYVGSVAVVAMLEPFLSLDKKCKTPGEDLGFGT